MIISRAMRGQENVQGVLMVHAIARAAMTKSLLRSVALECFIAKGPPSCRYYSLS
jgi:hypothetical protein